MAFAARTIFVCLSLLSVGGCATPQLQTPMLPADQVAREEELQRKFAFEHARDDRIRLLQVTYRLTTASADLCGDNVTGATGLFLWSARNFRDEEQKLARAAYDIHDGYSVLAVAADSPAAKAGLRAGDRIVSVDGVAVPEATRASLSVMRDRAKAAFAKKQPLSMVIAHKGSRDSETVTVPLIAACDYQAGIVRNEIVNAFADGSQIVVTTGMMNFVRSDEELAMIVGHELSHNFLGHIDAQRTNAVLATGAGILVDALLIATTGYDPRTASQAQAAGAMAFSVAFEQEADYAGLYVMRRAGYEIDGVANLWRRMALDDTRMIGTETDHPTSAARFVALEAAVREIKDKEAKHQALIPALKRK
jgi:Zn-dependent protease with chaperone function